jgi:hypothetical protein
MILDVLTVLFLVSGLLLVYFMVRERRRDVLHGNYVSKSDKAAKPRPKPTEPDAHK